jgi:hypothetical protein
MLVTELPLNPTSSEACKRGRRRRDVRVQALEGGNVLLHLRVSGNALLARQLELYRLQPLKHVPVLWMACDLQRALALSEVPREIGFDRQFVPVSRSIGFSLRSRCHPKVNRSLPCGCAPPRPLLRTLKPPYQRRRQQEFHGHGLPPNRHGWSLNCPPQRKNPLSGSGSAGTFSQDNPVIVSG